MTTHRPEPQERSFPIHSHIDPTISLRKTTRLPSTPVDAPYTSFRSLPSPLITLSSSHPLHHTTSPSPCPPKHTPSKRDSTHSWPHFPPLSVISLRRTLGAEQQDHIVLLRMKTAKAVMSKGKGEGKLMGRALRFEILAVRGEESFGLGGFVVVGGDAG